MMERESKPTVSLLITSFKRPHLLEENLKSIIRQDIPFSLEVIILNDGIEDETIDVCRKFKNELNIKYIFTGVRNLEKEHIRPPGFAFNVGVKQSKGDIIILSCAEMYSMNDTIKLIVNPLFSNKNFLSIPHGKDDENSNFLNALKNGVTDLEPFYNNGTRLNVHLPFFMALSRDSFYKIGGYDEDFTGIAFEDNDLIHRLQRAGCTYVETEAKVIHLYHHRYQSMFPEREAYNKSLYIGKSRQIVRNQNKEWGTTAHIIRDI